jgi:mannose-6-phosphate isomerase-like protein (cupin superfamily)
MTESESDPIRFTVAECLARIPGSKGERFVVVLERGTLSVELYAPRGTDPQQPHARDELYVVVAGQGTFVRGTDRVPFGPGDCLFAAAGVAHRFVDFTEDLAVWVMFYGPPGGEKP